VFPTSLGPSARLPPRLVASSSDLARACPRILGSQSIALPDRASQPQIGTQYHRRQSMAGAKARLSSGLRSPQINERGRKDLRALGLMKGRADAGFADETDVPYKIFRHEVGAAAWPSQSKCYFPGLSC